MANTKKVGPFDWLVPLKGITPWDGLVDVLFNQMGLDIQVTKTGAAGTGKPTQLQWGDVDTGNYAQADDNADAKFFGNWDRQNKPWKNLTVEVASKPATPTVARTLFDDDKAWVAGKGGGSPVWIPVTKPFLTVTSAGAGSRQRGEYPTVAAALAAATAGDTVLLLPGSHAVATELLPPSGVRIVGLTDKAILDFSTVTDAQCIRIEDKTDVAIENVAFTGVAAKSAITIISSSNEAAARIQIKGCRFAVCVNAVQVLEKSGADFEVVDILVRDCWFDGTNTICENAVYTETTIQRMSVEDCYFKGWGEAGSNQHCIEIAGNATSGPLRIDRCHFDVVGDATAENAIDLNDIDDVSISGCMFDTNAGDSIAATTVARLTVASCIFKTVGGSGLNLSDVTDFVISDCDISSGAHGVVTAGTQNRGSFVNVHVLDTTGSGAVGFKFVQLDDSTLVGCSARGATSHGFQFTTCDRVVVTGCRVDNCGGNGFDLVSGTYMVFSGCWSSGNTGEDLNGAVAATSCHLGFVLSKKAGGTWSATCGTKRSHKVALMSAFPIDGTPVLQKYGSTDAVAWAFDKTSNEKIAMEWTVPDNVLPGSDIDARVFFSGVTAPSSQTVDWDVSVTPVIPGTTNVTSLSPTTVSINDQTFTEDIIKRSDKGTIAAAVWETVGAGREMKVWLVRDAASDDYNADAQVLAFEFEVVETAIEIRA